MRILSASEAPDRGERHVGHQVVTEYFAQDEATRLDPQKTVYETLMAGSPMHMVPAIRNILGGFLFSGDDIYKKCAVLSGGERTRLAVARMLLRPSNLLLLDEPTNHLDLDSKDVLLDALVDYGGTLIFVSHDRYFVERLATRIIEVGGARAESFPGTYPEFLWRKEHLQAEARTADTTQKETRPQPVRAPERRTAKAARAATPAKPAAAARVDHDQRKRELAAQRKQEREKKARQARLTDLEARIAAHEESIRSLEAQMAAPGFYDDRDGAQVLVARHQSLMWEVGEMMHQWEMLAELAEDAAGGDD
jgi:ATP-binding cassette subfamily F protein 3